MTAFGVIQNNSEKLPMAVRKGRPRQAGPRYPSGDPIPKEPPAPALVKRIQTVAQLNVEMDRAKKEAKDPVMATMLGMLAVQKIITATQALAGKRWAELVGEYERVCGFPRRWVASPSYEMGYVGWGSQGGPELEQAKVDRIKREYDEARAILLSRAGLVAVRTVNAVCVENRCLDWPAQEHFFNGLDVLARFFSVDKSRKS
jgi:hypothetical protein